MPSLFEEQPWWTTADNNALSRERDKKLPVRSSFFNALVPQVSAKDAAVNRPILDETQRGQPGVISKLLIGGAANAAETFGMPGVFDPSGDIRNQSWGNALKASAWLPADTAKSAYDAVVDPSRAASGEMSPKGGVYQDELGNYVDETGKPLSEYRDEMLSSGLNIAGTAAMTGSIAPKPRNAAGMFGGRLAKTADHAKLKTAEEMAAKGLPREDIWSQTGWFKGVDGKWRFEIDDSGATLPYSASGKEYQGPIRALLNHPNLMTDYPDVGAGKGWLTIADHVNGSTGTAYKNGNVVVTSPTATDARTTLLHEVQHQVQHREGFESGSGGIVFPSAENWQKYMQNAGENEARAVEKRADLTPEQRSSRPPWLDYDVPESQQIVRLGANTSEATAPGVVVSEAARQPRPVQMEIPFYRGSAHGQTGVDYDKPFWGTTDKNLASDYAKSRSEMYFREGTTPNVAPAVGRFRNPLYIDAQNAGWSDIPFEGQKWNSDKLAETAKERGHDGLVIDHLYDEGKYDPAAGLPATVAALRPGTVSSAFDPNNILYANSKSSGVPGAMIAEASKRVENPDDAILEILRRYGVQQ